MEEKRKYQRLDSLFVFLGLYAGAGIFTGSFGKTCHYLTAFMITMGVSFCLNKEGKKEKH